MTETQTVFKRCESWTEHPAHEVRFIEDDYDAFDQPEDYSCPGIVTLVERIEALQRRADLVDALQHKLYQAEAANHKLQTVADYHREQHGLKSEALHATLTSPDTKAAHEAGYKNGFAAASARDFDSANLEREIDRALMPALQHCARLEQEVTRANQALNTAYRRIDALFNPAAPVHLDPVEELAEALGTTGEDLRARAGDRHHPLCVGYHRTEDGACETTLQTITVEIDPEKVSLIEVRQEELP